MFAQWKGMRNTLYFEDGEQLETKIAEAKTAAPLVNPVTGVTVDPACNVSITVSCLKQLYNAVDYKAKAANKNSIAITSYLEEFANFADLQTFYKDQVPEAVGTNFTVISVKGKLHFDPGCHDC
jgi:tripeptidyl-peptidase-1